MPQSLSAEGQKQAQSSIPKCIPSFSRSFHGLASFFLSGILACMVLFLSYVVADVSIDLFKATFKVRCERQGFYAQFIDNTKSEVAVFQSRQKGPRPLRKGRPVPMNLINQYLSGPLALCNGAITNSSSGVLGPLAISAGSYQLLELKFRFFQVRF